MRSYAIRIAAVFYLALAASAMAQNAVTTVAGGGSTKVTARSASIGDPAGLAIDKSGNLYVAGKSTEVGPGRDAAPFSSFDFTVISVADSGKERWAYHHDDQTFIFRGGYGQKHWQYYLDGRR